MTPAIETEFDQLEALDLLSYIVQCSLFSPLTSIPVSSTQEEAEVRSCDKLALVKLILVLAVYAVVSSANVVEFICRWLGQVIN